MTRTSARYYAKEVYKDMMHRGVLPQGTILNRVAYEIDLDANQIRVSYLAGFDGWETVPIAKGWING